MATAAIAVRHGKQSAARTALLTRGGGPDGSAAVALNRWRYRSDPLNRGLAAGWSSGDWRGREVRVPHSPNGSAHAGEAGRRAYAGSIGWYAREIDAPVAGQYSLQFESAHYRAQVYVDGRLLRSHTGAYEPFSARPALTPGRHTVAVRVDWRDPQRQSDEDWQRAWFNYGGLNRPVTLSRLGPSRLGALTLRTRLTASGRARVDVTLRVRNRADTRRIQPTGSLEHDGDAVALRFDPLTVGRGASKTARASVVLDDPALWSPTDPQRYALKIAVAGEATLARPVGLREITWDGDGLSVNGDRIVLAGAALPADARGHGDALTERDERRMIAQLRSLGANATRSQLPLSQPMLDRLDAAGIFVWQEIGPWEPAGRWRANTPAQLAAVRDRALRTAEEGQTHASILAWTLTNEAPGQGHPGQQRYVATTARRLHAFDPGRPVAADLWGSRLPRSDGPLFAELDAIGVTDYIGWYERPLDGAPAQAALARERIAKLRAPVSRQAARRDRARRRRQRADRRRAVRQPGLPGAAAGAPHPPAARRAGRQRRHRLGAARLRAAPGLRRRLGEPPRAGTDARAGAQREGAVRLRRPAEAVAGGRAGSVARRLTAVEACALLRASASLWSGSSVSPPFIGEKIVTMPSSQRIS